MLDGRLLDPDRFWRLFAEIVRWAVNREVVVRIQELARLGEICYRGPSVTSSFLPIPDLSEPEVV